MAKKAFISIVLLLTYSLGFTHNIVPHNHDETVKSHKHEHDDHQHHHHNSNHLHEDHEHISHGAHYDEGWYDLLVCFIHEAHQTEDCKDHNYLVSKTNNIIINKLKAKKLVTILYSIVMDTEIFESISNCQFDSEIYYLPPLIEDNPLRGPPSIS